MKNILLIISVCLTCAGLAHADAGYGRGPESDPVAMPILTNLQASVWGAPGLTPATNLLTNAVTIQAKSIAGGDLAGYRVLHVWVSGSDLGAGATNNIAALTLSTGTAISTVTTNADYWYCTAAAGSAVATVTASAAGTNYLMCADGSTVSSTPIVFTSE